MLVGGLVGIDGLVDVGRFVYIGGGLVRFVECVGFVVRLEASTGLVGRRPRRGLHGRATGEGLPGRVRGMWYGLGPSTSWAGLCVGVGAGSMVVGFDGQDGR
jgi:hypothetical protein